MERTDRPDTAVEILETARAVFSEKGYEHATTREIAERAGIAKGLLYYHFKSKEEMLFRLCLRAADDLIGAMRDAVQRNREAGGSLRDRVVNIALRYARSYLGAKDFNKILFHDLDYLRGEWRETIVAKQTENVHLLRDYLQELQGVGELRDRDPTVLTFSLVSSIHWLFFWYKPSGPLTLEQVVGQIADTFLFGAAEARPGGYGDHGTT